jgi:N-terminal acetyltransferase B complex non-catalytic subunit
VALQKAFPKERKYNFWKTLFSYLVHGDPTLEDGQRKLFGMLAYRFISKAAETVPEDKVQCSSSGQDGKSH